MSSLIWGPSNIPALSFSILIQGNFSWTKTNPLPSMFITFTKFFMTWYLFNNPTALAGWDTVSTFKQSLTRLDSEFSFSLTGCLIKTKETYLSYYLPLVGVRMRGFIHFSRELVISEMHWASFRIWTRVAISISYDDNHYTTETSLITWHVRVEAIFCSVQWEDETERYASQVLTLVLTTTLVWHVSRQPGWPRDTENKNTLCTWNSRTSPTTLRSPLIVLLVVNSRQQMIYGIVSSFHLYRMPNRSRWKIIPIM